MHDDDDHSRVQLHAAHGPRLVVGAVNCQSFQRSTVHAVEVLCKMNQKLPVRLFCGCCVDVVLTHDNMTTLHCRMSVLEVLLSLPARRYDSAGNRRSYGPVSVCLCRPMSSGVLLKWSWVYAKGRVEGPEGTLYIYDH